MSSVAEDKGWLGGILLLLQSHRPIRASHPLLATALPELVITLKPVASPRSKPYPWRNLPLQRFQHRNI